MTLKHIILSILTLTCCTAMAQTVADSIAPVHAVAIPSASDSIADTRPGTVADLSAAADSAYTADNYALAEQLYLQSIAMHGSSSTIFYNLGNSYYRQNNLGKAIVNYERALKLDPTNADALANLRFVQSKIIDKQNPDSSIINRLWNGLVSQYQANTWAWISIVLFALLLSGAMIYLFSSSILIRKISFFGGIIGFILCTITLIISFSAASRLESDRYAIILQPSVQLSTTPREARNPSENAFLLHEGTKVEIVDSISTAADGNWYEVLVGGTDKRAWIRASEVEKI